MIASIILDDKQQVSLRISMSKIGYDMSEKTNLPTRLHHNAYTTRDRM